MNGQGQLQCQQDPKDVTRVGSVKELPLCREKPIFHEPVGTLITDKEQLTAMYPNSFDRIGSLKGEYKIDPSVGPVQPARRKVPIESKEAICVALDSKTSWGSLKDRLIDLFSNKGFPKEIISDNSSPFNSQEFADYLSSHSVKHTTSSPNYPQSNGFMEHHIQTVRNLLYKAMDAELGPFRKFSLS